MGKPTGKSRRPGKSPAERDDERDKRMALERAVGNRIVRSQLRSNRVRIEKRAKSSRRRKRQKLEASGVPAEDLPAPQLPKKIESERVYDEETGQPLSREEALAVVDEFTDTLSGDVKPRVTITTGLHKTTTSFDFCKALLPVIPLSP